MNKTAGNITLAVVFINLFFIFLTFSLVENRNEAPAIADGFTIEKYNVILDVKEDNKIDVTENITINFTNGAKHGIYKFIPEWLEYTGKDGKTIKRKSLVLNYRAEGEEYTVDVVNHKKRIKIGSANKTVGLGNKDYTIKYTYNMGNDPFNGFDELIFHAFGDYWGTEIKNASIQVNMPKSIEGNRVNFFTDKYRINNANDFVNYSISGNTLYANFDSFSKPLNNSLTIDIELPDGYFTGGSFNYGWGSFIISMIVLSLTAITITMWIKYGKDFEKKAKTVEFYPPDDLNAAEIGYIFNKNQASKKLTIGLIIQLASKGYIKIDEIGEKKKEIKITSLLAPPNVTTNFDRMNRPIVNVSNEQPIKYNQPTQPLTSMEHIVYDHLFETSNEIILSEHETFYLAFSDIDRALNDELKNRIHDELATKKTIGAVIRNVVISILSIISYMVIEDLNPNWSILYKMSFLCIFINMFFTIIMARKTEYGELITARVKGFKNFLETAEKSKLEALVAENPTYFYDILPYTYVLNISKKWIKKFENIPMPQVDMGTFDYNDTSSYSNFSNDIYYPSSSGSNSSSCGGGCSSCGGGCSSCGGGGSW